MPVLLTLLGVLCMAAVAVAGSGQGYLGIHLQDLDDSLLLALDLEDVDEGVLVTEVVEGSPAERAGIQRGDVLVRFDGNAVRSSRGLTRRVTRTDPETTVTVQLIRKGERISLDVEVGEREDDVFVRERLDSQAPEAFFFRGEDGPSSLRALRFGILGGPRLGVRVEPMNEDLGRYFGTDAGLLVLGVEEETPAEKAGLRIGDVIVSVDGERVEDVEGLRDALAEREDGDEVTVVVQRDRRSTELKAILEIPENLEFGRLHELPQGMQWFGTRDDDGQFGITPHIERLRLHREGDDLHDQVDDLREEIERLRKELEEMRDQ